MGKSSYFSFALKTSPLKKKPIDTQSLKSEIYRKLDELDEE
jgi:hypothetical protein